jgi:spore germination protein YaaH
MLKTKRAFGMLLAAMFILMTFMSYMPAKAATPKLTVPKIKFYSDPKTEYTAGDIVYFKLHSPGYSGRIQYRVVLWHDETKSYKDLWTTGDRYYKNWQPYGSEIFNLHWGISEPGHYRITIYAKRAGIPNSQTALKGYNSDSYMAGVPFVVKPKDGVSRGDNDNVGTGRYVSINENTQLLADTNGTLAERYTLKGETYEIYGEDSGHFKIKVGKIYGYVPIASVTRLSNKPNSKITIAWDQISTKAANASVKKDGYVTRNSVDLGLDVLSPTWFGMTGDPNKPITFDFADTEYVKIAHKNGYEVWPRFVEMDKNRAYIWLNDPAQRTKFIEQIVTYAKQYDIDGINFDFEVLGDKNKDGYTIFMKEAYTRLKQEGLTVSTDVMTPASWNNWYNNSVVKDYVDYMMLMAYDEHYSGSTAAGSVGSYTFVEKAIKGTLDQGVPSSKLVLAVPFYLRNFTVEDANSGSTKVKLNKDTFAYISPDMKESEKWGDLPLGTEIQVMGALNKDIQFIPAIGDAYIYIADLNGEQVYIFASDAEIINDNSPSTSGKVTASKSMSMTEAKDQIASNKGTIYYDDKAKQYYGLYYKNGLKNLIWIEDKDTMAWRMDLANQYGLSGMAAWSLYWKPTEDIWSVIKTKLK